MSMTQLYRLRRRDVEVDAKAPKAFSGCEGLGRRDRRGGPRSSAADLPQQAIKGTPSFGHQRFEPPELGRRDVAKLPCQLDDCLHLRQRTARRVEEPTVFS